MLREVRIGGELGRALGAEALRLDVATPREAIRALVFQVPGARTAIREAEWIVLVDGRPLGELELLAVRRNTWRRLELLPALEGANFRRGPLKIIAGVFLIGASLLFGPIGGGLGALAFGKTTAWIVGGLGASMALQGVSQLLSPLPRMDYQLPESAERRQSALFTGGSNFREAGHPVPLVFGRVRGGSVRVSLAIVTEDDPAAVAPDLVSRSRATVVEVLSEGEIAGLTTGDAVSILLGETRLEEASGTVNFPDVDWELVEGAAADPATVSHVERIEPVEAEATCSDGSYAQGIAGAVVRTIDEPEIDAIRCTAALGPLYTISGGLPVAAPLLWRWEVSSDGGPFKSAHPSTPVRFSYRVVGAGTWTDVEVEGHTVYFNNGTGYWETYYQLDVQGLAAGQYEWKYTDLAAPGQTQVVGPRQVTVYVGGSPAAVYPYLEVYATQSTETNVDGLLFTLRLDYLDSPGIPYLETSGRVLSERYEHDHVIGDLVGRYGPAPWTVRLVKYVTQDETNPSTAANRLAWARFAEVIEREFAYDDVARIKLEFDADVVGGRLPDFRFELDGIKVRVPSNLTTSTRTYAGSWDGTFKSSREWYDNPAWILFELATNTRWGLGLADTEVDKWSFYAAAQACDELVDDGRGGTEPRFRYWHQHTVREDSFRLLLSIASAMQAQLWWGDGVLFITQDLPAPAARLFTNGTVVDGVFRYAGVARSARYTAARVTWRNPANGWDADPVPVDLPFAVDRYGRNELDLVALGCASRGQALRRGRYDLFPSLLETQSITFRCGYRDAQLEPGEIIEIRDAARETIRDGGRMKASSGQRFLIPDVMPPGLVATGKTLRVQLDDGSIHASAFGVAGASFDLITGTLLPVGRAVRNGAPWTISASDRRLARVLSVAEVSQGVFEVEALEHDPTKQDRIEDFADIGTAILPPSLPSVSAPVIDALAVEYDAGADLWTVVVTWHHTDADGFWARFWEGIGSATIGNDPPITPALSASSPTRIALGDHATFGGELVGVGVYSITRDGAVESAYDLDTITVPASPP